MVCVVRVGQHAGNQAVNCGEPLDDFEPVMLVDGEAHPILLFRGRVRWRGRMYKLCVQCFRLPINFSKYRVSVDLSTGFVAHLAGLVW